MRSRPTAAAALLYALLAVALYAPALLPGRTLSASDFLWTAAPWAAERPAGVRPFGSNYELIDSAVQFQPWLEHSRERMPSPPLWNPNVGLGRPFLANAQSAWLSPFSLPAYFLPFWWSLGVIAVLKVFTAAFGTFLLARALAMGYAGSLLAGLVYGFSLYFVVWIAWPQSGVWALLPWLLLLAELALRRPGPLPAAGLAAVVAAQFFAGHPESSFHLLVTAAAFVAFRIVVLRREGRLARLRAPLLAVGAGVAGGVLLAALLLSPSSSCWRGPGTCTRARTSPSSRCQALPARAGAAGLLGARDPHRGRRVRPGARAVRGCAAAPAGGGGAVQPPLADADRRGVVRAVRAGGRTRSAAAARPRRPHTGGAHRQPPACRDPRHARDRPARRLGSRGPPLEPRAAAGRARRCRFAARLLVVGPWLLVPLGAAGAMSRIRDRRFRLWAAFIPVYAVSVALFFVASRYRLPLLLAFAVCAAGIFEIRRVWPVALAAALACVTLWPFGLDSGRSYEETNMAVYLISHHRVEEASNFIAAVAPHHADPARLYLRAGLSYAQAGEDARAIDAFEHVLRAPVAQPVLRATAADELAEAYLHDGRIEDDRRLLSAIDAAPLPALRASRLGRSRWNFATAKMRRASSPSPPHALLPMPQHGATSGWPILQPATPCMRSPRCRRPRASLPTTHRRFSLSLSPMPNPARSRRRDRTTKKRSASVPISGSEALRQRLRR